MDIAPSRSLKSYTSNEVMRIFDKSFYINLKSDFTMNSLRRYAEDLSKGKCLFVNDGTVEFASKSQRTKDRLVGGLSELLADGVYSYQDFGQKFTLKGKVTMVMNMTSEAFQNYKDRLFGLTFAERFFTAHHALSEQEKHEWIDREERSAKTQFGEKITQDDIETDVRIPKKYYQTIRYLAQDFSYMSLKTFIGCRDIIKATLKAHASLNHRDEVCRDDLEFIRMIKDYLVNPFSPYEGKVDKYRAEGFSIRDICKKIDRPNYIKQVQRVVQKAELRGILPLKNGSNVGVRHGND